MQTEERWAEIPGYSEYLISTEGRVKIKSFSDGRGVVRKEHIMVPQTKPNEAPLARQRRPFVTLGKGLMRREFWIVELMARTFMADYDREKNRVGYRDRAVSNVRLANLFLEPKPPELKHSNITYFRAA